ncbi:MAG: hypothetical protein K2O34_06545 [Acetatifactor sp.]|nr:hypothetical protein [Acetatifactor sp.]
MKKISIVLTAMLGLVAAIVGTVLFAAGVRGKENLQIHTETQPIYNHFPDLPGTPEVQWCSRTSEGVGLTTVEIYFFAFYDHDVSNELQDVKIKNQSENIELYFIPEGMSENEKWRQVECPKSAPFSLQTGVKESARFYAEVYINEAGTVLYVEGVGD